MKKKLKWVLLAIAVLMITIYLCNYIVTKNAVNKTFSEIKKVPEYKVGLVLGTAKYLKNGQVNLYYTYRVEAAEKLFKEHKVAFLIISGDNGTKAYDEPTEFKKDLIAKGIPEEKIYLDYAGFRTLDSVVRVKEIFGQDAVLIISQKFHNERAIYLAEQNGIKAMGFNAKDVYGNYGIKVTLREYLARVKLFIDILFKTQPKFLGEKIIIE